VGGGVLGWGLVRDGLACGSPMKGQKIKGPWVCQGLGGKKKRDPRGLDRTGESKRDLDVSVNSKTDESC